MNDRLKSIALASLLFATVAFSWLQPLDTIATTHVDAGLKRALFSYGIARTLNAVISVLQGTEVSVQAGVGATFAPGQVLGPINNLVEQFGDWMLAASVAFGIMHVLIQIGSYWLFSLLLTISASVWLWMLWKKMLTPDWLIRIIIILLFVRFSIPIVAVGNEYFFNTFLEADYTQNQNAIQLNSDEVATLENDINTKIENDGNITVQPKPNQIPPNEDTQVTPKDSGWKDKLSADWNSLKNKAGAMRQEVTKALKITERIGKLKQNAAQIVEHIVKLIVVFILQTIIIPIGLLFIMYKVGLSLTRTFGGRMKFT